VSKANVEEIIERMLIATNAAKPADLQRKAGMSGGAISTWRRRGHVPDKGIALVSEISGAPFEWIKTGEGERYGPRREGFPGNGLPHLDEKGSLWPAGLTTQRQRKENLLTLFTSLDEESRRVVETIALTLYLKTLEDKKESQDENGPEGQN
jgi:Bacteriophage CI repressor helix-turn-helix domain